MAALPSWSYTRLITYVRWPAHDGIFDEIRVSRDRGSGGI